MQTLWLADVETPTVEKLSPRDVPSLPITWRNRFSHQEITTLVSRYPGRSVWEPESGEFVLASPWRHRHEVAILAELAGVRHVRPLIDGVIEQCRNLGDKLVLTAEMHERQRPEFWNGVGLIPLEDVVSFALTVSHRDSLYPIAERMEFRRVDPLDRARISELVTIDNTSFPWLWWNNHQEFEAYLAVDEVEVYLSIVHGRPVGYAGFTRYDGWMHLDRIAVLPAWQGRGYGRNIVRFVLNRARTLRFRQVALSTQRANRPSRSLYEAMGFQRARDHDYRIYGRWLVDPRTLPGPGDGI